MPVELLWIFLFLGLIVKINVLCIIEFSHNRKTLKDMVKVIRK